MRTGGRRPAPSASTISFGTSIPVAVFPARSSVVRNFIRLLLEAKGIYAITPAPVAASWRTGALQLAVDVLVGPRHQPDEVSFRVGELPELDWCPRYRCRTEDAGAAEGLGPRERGCDVGHLDVERDVSLVAGCRRGGNPAPDAAAVRGSVPIAEYGAIAER